MVLNKQQKEDLIIELLEKGLSVQQIAQQAHASFSTIKEVRQKITGEIREDKEKELLISSQSFKLFLEGKSPTEVAIELDLPTQQVLQFHTEYLILQNRGYIVSILKNHKNSIPAFLKWFKFLDYHEMKAKDIALAIRYVANRNYQLKQKEDLDKEIESLIDERDYLLENIKDIKESQY
jgi:AraC-like DNA-binding protein